MSQKVEKDRNSLEQRLQFRSENCKSVWTEVNTERTEMKPLKQVSDHVGSNRVHADDNQWERPFLVSLQLDDPTKRSEEQEANSTAE